MRRFTVKLAGLMFALAIGALYLPASLANAAPAYSSTGATTCPVGQACAITVGGTSVPASPSSGAIPNVTVTCYVGGSPPFAFSENGGKYVEAAGYIADCTPMNPDACSTQTELQVLDTESHMWVTDQTGPTNYECPGTSGQEWAYALEQCYGNTSFYFRTLTIVSIFYGNTATESYISQPTELSC